MRQHNKIVTVTIGIPAYNSQDIIVLIVNKLLLQKERNIRLKNIIIYSDGSSDNTVKVTQEINDKRVVVIKAKTRKGFAYGVQMLLGKNTSDIFLLLNDDIKITGTNLLEMMINPFRKNNNVGMVSGNPQPLNGQNFLEKAIISTFRAYENMRNSYRDGNNEFTCDGKILALSKQFIKKLTFPSEQKNIGNVDTFLYFSALKNGFVYQHIKDAKVYYKCPDTVSDYINWSTRNNANFYLMKKMFGNIVDSEYRKPSLRFLYYAFWEFVKNPLGCLYIYVIGVYIKYKARSAEKWFTQTWDVVKSTKRFI